MAHHLATIQSDPLKGGMRKVVYIIPAEFLGEKATHTCQSAELGDLGGVSKGIRKPKSRATLAKAALEKSLAVEKLSDQRLAAGHVGIMLDPTATDRMKLALFDPASDTVENRRVILFQPFKLLSLRAGETMLGIPVHQVALVGP